MFYQSTLNGVTQVSKWGAAPALGCETCLHLGSLEPQHRSGITKVKVSHWSLFLAEVSSVRPWNREQGKMLYLRQKRGKDKTLQIIIRTTPEGHKPKKNIWFIWTILLAPFHSMGQIFAVDWKWAQIRFQVYLSSKAIKLFLSVSSPIKSLFVLLSLLKQAALFYHLHFLWSESVMEIGGSKQLKIQ